MNLFISSSNYKNTPIPMVIGLICFIAVNLVVMFLPDSTYKLQFNGAINDAVNHSGDIDVVLFEDSRGTMFHHTFFDQPTLSLASDNNTVIFSKLLYDKMDHFINWAPEVIIIVLGANNYSKNSIFTIRDFAIRRLASLSDLIEFASFRDGTSYTIDGLFSKIIPVYGRRMEIRSPSLIKNLIVNTDKITTLQGMYKMQPNILNQDIKRNEIEDINYKLIYRRSIYANYELSLCHTGILESLIYRGKMNGSSVVLVQLPIEQDIMDIQKELVGDIFDDYLDKLEKDKEIIRLDMRNDIRFEMVDVNHLSFKGAHQFCNIILNPLIDSLMYMQNDKIVN